MSNLDNTSIDNHSSALSSTNFKNNNKKSKSKINSKVNSKNVNDSLEYNKSINNINTPHLKHYNKTKSKKIQFAINVVKKSTKLNSVGLI